MSDVLAGMSRKEAEALVVPIKCNEMLVPRTARSEAAFWLRTVVVEDCWQWVGKATKNGYGCVSAWVDGRSIAAMAHRVSYLWHVGEIPDGMTLDHLCNNPGCVNPSHLRPATQRDNSHRGSSPSAMNARKTTCKHGHAFLPSHNGRRRCLECERVSWRKYEASHVRVGRHGPRVPRVLVLEGE